MIHIDRALLDAVESFCHRFQRLTGRTNVWLAVQLTNLSVIVYFAWAGLFFLEAPPLARVVIGAFCAGVLYVLTQTIFKVPIEESEKSAYQRVAKGHRNPRRIRDALLRISFLTLSIVLAYPILFVYRLFAIRLALLSYFLILLTTAMLYLLACDPLPPCAGKLRVWARRLAPGRTRLAPDDVP